MKTGRCDSPLFLLLRSESQTLSLPYPFRGSSLHGDVNVRRVLSVSVVNKRLLFFTAGRAWRSVGPSTELCVPDSTSPSWRCRLHRRCRLRPKVRESDDVARACKPLDPPPKSEIPRRRGESSYSSFSFSPPLVELIMIIMGFVFLLLSIQICSQKKKNRALVRLGGAEIL